MTSYWRALRWASWLGWRIDSNWTAPWLFFLYVIVKPLAAAMLLVCMYWAAQRATGGQAAADFLPFLFISSACFMVIGGVTIGMSTAVISDRENYGMLKFVRISPIDLRGYLIGRGLSRAGQAVIGALLTMAGGVIIFPEMRQALGGPIAWGWLTVFVILGLFMLIFLGLILASAVLNMARYGTFLSEGVAGLLFLLSGAVFPIDILPGWLRACSMVLPSTYWLEGMRRSLVAHWQIGSTFRDWQMLELAAMLAAGTCVLGVCAHFFFRWSEDRAWRLGRYDENSSN